MTRTFYSYAIFFTGLYIVTGLLQSIILFLLGRRMYDLGSLSAWMLLAYSISLVWSLILLRYFHHKQHVFVFWMLIIYTAVSLVHFIIFMHVLQTREMTTYYITGMFLAPIAGAVYGFSLVVSSAGKNHLLRAAGFFILVIALTSFSTTVWAFNSVSVMLNGTLEKAEQWITIAAVFIPLFFFMNFIRETSRAEEIKTSNSLDTVVGFAALAAFALLLIVGTRFVGDTIRAVGNPSDVSKAVRTQAEGFEARTYKNADGDSLQYRLMVPLDYDPTQKYPLVVCLHGSSGCGSDNMKQVATSLPAYLLSPPEKRRKYPSFLFVPQCPLHFAWGGIPGVPGVDSLVFGAIDALQQEFSIDEDRYYVSGHSLGGYGTWHLISMHPEMFAAAIPAAGAGDPALADKIVEVPIWAFHGAEDRHVAVSGSRDMVAAIRKAGGHPRYTEFTNENHHIWRNIADTPGLLDWLFAQRRHPQKKAMQ
jgi:poly(3-hydroxybutyrate) depolymerase